MDNRQIYEPCPLHKQEFLQVVCMECEINSIACPICIDLSHKNHTMISLKKFISTEIPKLYAKKPDYKLLSKGINDLRGIYLGLFQKMRKTIGHELNELQKKYQNEIQALYQQNNVICGVGDKLYTHQNISLLKKKIKNNEKILQSKAFDSKINDLCGKMESLVEEVTEDVCEIIRSLSSFWETTKSLLLNSKREFQFNFSTSLKHKAISIEINQWKGKKIVNEIYDNCYHIGVVEPPLNPFMNEIQFKVEKSANKCVWIGVCDLRKIIDRKFSNCYKKNQGGYWIWQGGLKGGAQFFSSQLSESQNLPWNFDIGDIIKIRIIYEKENRFVQFQKEKEKIFRGKIDKANIYCACVAMGAENESVILVQQ